jgi:hypothetical protein
MLIHEAFDKTLDEYNISGRMLAKTAEVSDSAVSQFRRGTKGATDAMLNKLMGAMDELAPGSRRYFCGLLADDSGDERKILIASIDKLPEEDIPRLLMAIAKRWHGPVELIG